MPWKSLKMATFVRVAMARRYPNTHNPLRLTRHLIRRAAPPYRGLHANVCVGEHVDVLRNEERHSFVYDMAGFFRSDLIGDLDQAGPQQSRLATPSVVDSKVTE